MIWNAAFGRAPVVLRLVFDVQCSMFNVECSMLMSSALISFATKRITVQRASHSTDAPIIPPLAGSTPLAGLAKPAPSSQFCLGADQ